MPDLQFDGIHFMLFGAERVLPYYGMLLMLGAVAGAWLADREARRRGHDSEIVWDLFIYLLIGGIIGARLWHVFTHSPSSLVQDSATGEMVNPYFAGGYVHILDILAIWEGGLGIPGAVIGGAIVLFLYSRKHNLHFPEWADIAAPSLALGQAIGRWGNYFNQELYGAPTDLPWGISIDPAHRLAGYLDREHYHPLFLYESLWNLGNLFLLTWISRRLGERLKNGDILLTYLIVYPIGRFLLDFLRLDASLLGGVNINQSLMAVVALCSAAALYFRHRKADRS